jgi:DNA-binding response OmpR family regulator
VRLAGITTPAIALSAYTDTAQVKRALKAGFDRCLAKPVDLRELFVSVRELLEQKQELPRAS